MSRLTLYSSSSNGLIWLHGNSATLLFKYLKINDYERFYWLSYSICAIIIAIDGLLVFILSIYSNYRNVLNKNMNFKWVMRKCTILHWGKVDYVCIFVFFFVIRNLFLPPNGLIFTYTLYIFFVTKSNSNWILYHIKLTHQDYLFTV